MRARPSRTTPRRQGACTDSGHVLELAAVVLVLALVPAIAACGDDPPQQTTLTCTATRDCPGGQFCGCGGVCVTPAPCDSSAECCADEVCTDGLCLNVGACESDDDCPGARTCSGCACVPRGCDDERDCWDGELCEGGVCLVDDAPPCGGECGSGQACDPLEDACVPRPSSCDDVSCGPGESLIIAEVTERLGPVCRLERECACASAREVTPGAIGTEMSVVSVGESSFVALAHDHFYGDLVAVRLDGGEPVGLPEYIDGLPADTPGVDPDGLRQGLYAAGPERGAMPSAAVSGAAVGVAYRDDDAGTLRFARELGSAQWEVSVADATPGSGWFPSLAVAGDGRWVVAHLTRLDGTSELRLAVSTDAAPVGPEDWAGRRVDTGAGEVVEGEAVPAAVATYPSLVVEPGGIATMAYYNSVDGELRVARGPLGGPFTVSVLDPGLPASEIPGAADAGLYASLARRSDGLLGLAFVDRLSGEVRYGELVDGDANDTLVFGGDLETVDPGRRQSPPVQTGADLQLTHDLNGRALAVYQDTSGGDLVMSTRVDGAWRVTPLLRSGVAGFSPHVFADTEPFWVVHGLLVDEGRGDLVETIDARALPDL